jgi:predicted transport protein
MKEQNISNPTVEDHLNGAPQEIKDLFTILQKKIFELDQVKENSTRRYIGYNFVTSNDKPKLFVELHIQKQKKRIVLHLRPCEYVDPGNKIFPYNYIPKWPLRTGLIIVNEQDLIYSIPLIKTSYKDISSACNNIKH